MTRAQDSLKWRCVNGTAFQAPRITIDDALDIAVAGSVGVMWVGSLCARAHLG